MDEKVKKKKIRGIIIAALILSLSVVTGVKKFFNSNLTDNIVFYETAEKGNSSGKSNSNERIDYELQLAENNDNYEVVSEDFESFDIMDSEGTSSNKSKKININTASSEELQTLYRIGPATAKKIIEYRQTYGDFVAIEEIKEVKGIGDAIFNSIKDQISVK